MSARPKHWLAHETSPGHWAVTDIESTLHRAIVVAQYHGALHNPPQLTKDEAKAIAGALNELEQRQPADEQTR